MADAIQWITREEWQRKLDRSRDLMARVEFERRKGYEPPEKMVAELQELNHAIRNPSVMKVRGIDDRTVT